MATRKQAIEVTDKTKRAVIDRQKFMSISGASLFPNATEFHHVLPRSSSGVGYEWNIVALTFDEHRAYHDHQPIKVNGRVRYTWEEFDTLIHNHMKINYDDWSESKCKFQKYKEEEDYAVHRRDKR